MATIKDVAKRAGVSTATVSRVLADKPYVRPEMKAKVLEAIAQLDYRPNLVARSLRAQRSNTIGLIVADIRNPFFTDISRSVEDTAYGHDYSVFLCNTDEDPEKEALYIELMRDENVAGVIMAPTKKTATQFNSLELEFPTVVIDRSVPVNDETKHDLVLIDNEEATHRLIDHMVDQGYKRIGGIFGKSSYTGSTRRKAFLAALSKHNLTADPDHIHVTPSKRSLGYAAAMELLQMSKPPDAIVTTNSLFTAAVVQAARELKVKMPTQLGLAGFDDAPWTTLVEPPVTVISQPTKEMGRSATELLLDRIEDPEIPGRKITLSVNLLVRESTQRKG